MPAEAEIWKPGSFTKNFSWGHETGLRRLHESIKLGFDNKLENVPREIFRQRASILPGSPLIPMNFFLFNKKIDGEDHILVDELVFQGITSEHSDRFDKLAIFAFNFSYAGKFSRASREQRRPALWALHYIKERVSQDYGWDTARINADDIQNFIENDNRYKAQTARKLSTNLAHLYKIGKIKNISSDKIERWWVDALFLALDRLINNRLIDGHQTSGAEYLDLIRQSDFFAMTGKKSLEKDLAAKHLVRLYSACGSVERFSEEAVKARTQIVIKDFDQWISPNNDEPWSAFHPSNPRILKTIPNICAMLAVYAGFEVLNPLQTVDFDPDEFIRTRTRETLRNLRSKGISPTMTAEEVLRLTREK
ncbi:hypothetical protein [Nitrospirillum sp. BR 11163]|uniref:hypothetical protein n=1 Tax=Nitrospirillum sp. BR 11163 TaxID=3104323 RepID=UPI002AFEE0AA|nr:hypothetical protein [Nitrospirillum sp. BR 11163]MEA1674803.1 hypothetical protein [Nitrospirillum sp. BR 11163]